MSALDRLGKLLDTFASRRAPQGVAAIAGNIGWLSLDKVIRIAVALAVGVWLARYLGPDRYGQFQYAVAFASIFAAVISLGLHGILVREVIRDECREPTLFGTGFVMQGVASLALWVLMVGISAVSMDGDGVHLVMVLGACFLFKTSEIVKYWFEAKLSLKHVVWVENAALLLVSAAKLALIAVEAPLIAFAWATLLEAALAATGLAWIYSTCRPSMPRWRWQTGLAATLLRESWPIILANVAIAAYLRIDQIMLGAMLDSHEVGVYAAAVRVVESIYFLPAAIAASIVPALMEARRSSREQYHSAIERTLALSFALSVAITLPLAALATPIMSTLFGAPYQAGSDVLRLYAFALPFVFIGAPAGKWFLLEGMQMAAMYRVLSGLAVNVGLNMLLIPEYGALGAAVATFAALGMSNIGFNAITPSTRPIFLMQCRAMLPWRFRVAFNRHDCEQTKTRSGG